MMTVRSFNCLSAFLLAVFSGGLFLSSAQAVDITLDRSLPSTCVAFGSNYTTSVSVTIDGEPPTGMIVQEILPEGWTVVSATWNGTPIMPQEDGQLHKWLFGFNPPVGSGTLTYTTSVTNAFERSYTIEGVALYTEDNDDMTIPTDGDEIVRSCDTDGDGIPNDWETEYGLNPDNHDDAAEHWDSDPLNNLQEYLADTNPTNSQSSLELIDIEISEDDIEITWKGGAAAAQYVESATISQETPVWDCRHIIVPPTGVTNTWSHSDSTGLANQIYRIRAIR